MTFVEIQTLDDPPPNIPLLQLGFRPFFLAAALQAVLAVGLWMAVYRFGVVLPMEGVTASQWHAHEMIYGFALAVIAGFLLTAVKNWTHIQTCKGWKLAGLVGLWGVARLVWFFGTQWTWLAAVADIAFIGLLWIAVATPIVKARQVRQAGILMILALLGIGNVLSYVGVIAGDALLVHRATYGGIYLVLGMILLMGRRVVPFFIQKGLDASRPVRNFRVVDAAMLPVFAVYAALELVPASLQVRSMTAGLLFALLTLRLIGWYRRALWGKPLLWSLYLAFCAIALGFGMSALAPVWPQSPFLALHAQAYGGIGLVTLGMMIRVTLGHTGRNIHHPPMGTGWALGLLVLGTLVRVVVPLVAPSGTVQAVLLAQGLWMLAFLIFLVNHTGMLLALRPDGKAD